MRTRGQEQVTKADTGSPDECGQGGRKIQESSEEHAKEMNDTSVSSSVQNNQNEDQQKKVGSKFMNYGGFGGNKAAPVKPPTPKASVVLGSPRFDALKVF